MMCLPKEERNKLPQYIELNEQNKSVLILIHQFTKEMMMRFAFMALCFSFSAFAQMPGVPDLASKGKDLAGKVMAACKDDKSKVKGCGSYTELAPLKTCLMKNKEVLSPGCKQSLSLVK